MPFGWRGGGGGKGRWRGKDVGLRGGNCVGRIYGRSVVEIEKYGIVRFGQLGTLGDRRKKGWLLVGHTIR